MNAKPHVPAKSESGNISAAVTERRPRERDPLDSLPQSDLEATLAQFQSHLNALPPNEAAAVVQAATRALAPAEEPRPDVVAALTQGQSSALEEQVEAELELLRRSFARRRALLAGALSTAQVAELLGTSRQTPHDRVASGTLLAVRDRGELRFPPWQFSAEGEDGVVTGLPAVIRTLAVSPLAKVSWLTRASPLLGGETPLASLKAGRLDRVVALARAVGIT